MKRKTLTFYLITLGILLIFFLFRERLLFAAGNYLVVRDDLHDADVIHVIAGEDYRTEYAIELYKQGYAKTIFFTGGWCQFHGYYHGEHGKQVAFDQGVPSEAVVYDDTPVTSTYSEMLRLKAWMDQGALQIQSVIVVSDPFHMRRSKWTTQRVLGKETDILMAPVSFERTPYQSRWWEDDQSKRYVKEEYLKLAYYIARYKLGWGWVKEWLARLDTE